MLEMIPMVPYHKNKIKQTNKQTIKTKTKTKTNSFQQMENIF